MPSYAIDIGNSTDGPIGAVIRVKAPTPRHALEIVRHTLKESIGGLSDIELELQDDLIEYGTVYLNPDALKIEDVGDEEGIAEDDVCFVCEKPALEELVQLTEGVEPDPGTNWKGLVAEALDVIPLCCCCAKTHGVDMCDHDDEDEEEEDADEPEEAGEAVQDDSGDLVGGPAV